MSYEIEDVKYEDDLYAILEVQTGYEVYVKGVTCMTRKAQIGFTGEEGFEKAMKLIELGMLVR